MSEEKPYLADETLKRWRNRKVVVSIGGEHLFTGILKDFDEEVVVLGDVADFTGNRGRELLVKIDGISWIMLIE